MKTIYLSPSNQKDKLYNNKSEKKICREISNYLKEKLSNYEYNIYICDENSSIEEIIKDNSRLNTDIYLSFHIRKKYSNEYGPYLIYGKHYLSKKLCEDIFNQLKLVYPYNINDKNIQENFNIIEVSKISSPICFIEFLEDDLEWISKNIKKIINAIVIGINEYFINLN